MKFAAQVLVSSSSFIAIQVTCMSSYPRRMREGYGSRSVCVSERVCMSVTALAATYLFYTLKTRCH